jgi:hypothetical protein
LEVLQPNHESLISECAEFDERYFPGLKTSTSTPPSSVFIPTYEEPEDLGEHRLSEAQPQQNPHVPQHAVLKSNFLLKSLILQDNFHSQLFKQSNINLLYLVLPLLQLLLGALVEMPDHQASGGKSRNQMLHLHHLQQLLKDRMKKMVMKKKMMILNNKPSTHPLQILSISL